MSSTWDGEQLSLICDACGKDISELDGRIATVAAVACNAKCLAVAYAKKFG